MDNKKDRNFVRWNLFEKCNVIKDSYIQVCNVITIRLIFEKAANLFTLLENTPLLETTNIPPNAS